MDKKPRNRIPTEKRKGAFEGRETFLGICECGCGDPSAYFVDKPKEECGMQTLQLRAKAAGMSVRRYLLTQVEEIHNVETSLVVMQTTKGNIVLIMPKRTPIDPKDLNL